MKRLHQSLCFLFVSAQAATVAAQQSMGTLDKVKASGSITVAYREASIPFSYVVAGGQPVGFAWEICGHIVDRVREVTGRGDLTVRTQAVASQNRIPLMQNGTIDIECGATSNTRGRSEVVAFSTNYFYTGTRFLVNSSAPIESLEDLKGRRVASVIGTTNLQVMRRADREHGLNLQLRSARDHPEALLMLQSQRIDAYATDEILLSSMRANARDPLSLKIVGEPLQVEPYAVMLRRNDPDFKALVDGVIASLIASGEFQALYDKWFNAPIPPNAINLETPMSHELQANLIALSDAPAD